MNLSALTLGAKIASRELSCTEAVKLFCEKEDRYNSFITLDEAAALQQAAAVQKRLDAGEMLSPLAGVPVAVKDNLSTKGLRTTCASEMLADYVPVYDAFCVKQMKNAGMIILGKTNMDEFAMGWNGETSYYGTIRNPHDSAYCAGGSSGGSAAAVAGGLAPLALGTDTGGSVRQPASFCGIYGLKPTYGAVSRYGLIAYASSLDTVGVFGTTVSDTAAFYQIIKGRDNRDSTSLSSPDFTLESIRNYNLKGKTVGIPRQLVAQGEAQRAVEKTAQRLRDRGAEVVEVDLPYTEYAVSAYYVLACAEASSNLARYDGIRYGRRAGGAQSLEELYIRTRSEGFGSEVKKRLLLGSYVLSSGYYESYYLKAVQAKQLLKEAVEQALSVCDFLLAPVTAGTAFPLGEAQTDKMELVLSDIYTVPANLAGNPALTVPALTAPNGLPVGVQLLGRKFDEASLLGAAYQLRQDENDEV